MGGAAAAAAAAAIANAIKASGAIVSVEVRDFRTVLDRQEEPLLIFAESGFFSTKYRYLTSFKGFAFHTQTATPLELPARCLVIRAEKIWIPG
ncbi:MAG: hypothetical protein V3U66_02175 [Acidobacteriota bacterium]